MYPAVPADCRGGHLVELGFGGEQLALRATGMNFNFDGFGSYGSDVATIIKSPRENRVNQSGSTAFGEAPFCLGPS